MTEIESEVTNLELRRLVDAARGVWMRRLIDYSRANSLLYYRDLKVGTLDLTAETDAVQRLLLGQTLSVAQLTSSGTKSQSQDAVSREKGEAEARQRVRNALVALQRKALGNLEEKGIETLHLAIGMATWPASDGGRPHCSPVLLLPARIEARGRTSDDLRLLVAGEPQINPVLLYALEENDAIHLDASAILAKSVGEDESGQWRVDADGLLAKFEEAAAGVSELKLDRRVILANFQFAKMAMVEDLKRNGDALSTSSLVSAVAGHLESRQKLSQAEFNIEPAQLDERPAADDCLVLDADSTQHRAVVVVGKGQNCVVQGPPGTGKSQTIANIIAQSVAEGRRTLFVAEKRAALDAVIKRLSHPDVGLGHLVLDLHGASVSRKDVMARLANALDQVRHSLPAEGVESVHREFEARRKQLNEHARRVNQVRQPTGLSVNRIMGRLLRLRADARSSIRLRGETLAALTVEKADEVKQLVLAGTSHPSLLLGTDPSPWNNAQIPDGRRAQEAIDLVARARTELWPRFERLVGTVVQRLRVRRPASLADCESLLLVLRDARRIRERYGAGLYSAGPAALAQKLAPCSQGRARRVWAFLTNREYRGARRRLLELRDEAAPAVTLRDEALRAEDVLSRWRAHGPASDVPVVADGEIELTKAFAALSEATAAIGSITEAGSFNQMPLEAAVSRLQALYEDQLTPYQLPEVYEVRARLAKAGLLGFLDDIREHRVPPEHWVVRFEYVWLHSALDQVLASDPSFASFKGRTHEEIVSDFNRLDRERTRLASSRVRRLHAERAIEAMNRHFEQSNLVQTEARKKARHVPLRELLARAPEVLTRLAPCWVASPLSVSQLLDGGKRHFDLVVFDEASQILQEEAIPSLYRAEQVVVAGDRHQLPPTTFFATVVEGEDEPQQDDAEAREALATVTAAIGGFESLLDTLDAFLPNWLLEWHYRSEDERLITFSNTHVYDRRLVTFPSARGHRAVQHILVPHDPALGGQEESASREVDEVVREVMAHAEQHPTESLGVITMGIKHANRVQAALDRAIERRPDVSDFFSLDREERFFVKNLETVQGDERDAIILSIGYGKTAAGDLPHRFGPLTQDVGYRRLNVAVTRAKRRMCVISSFSHGEIDLNRSGGRGVQLLKAYLAYASNGGTQLPENERAGEVELNSFEADVRDALEARGIRTRSQFGASRYRIDLVAMHPEKPGRPVLAIECDGASYHSGATARDRDRLRQAHLQRLGWRFHRIWSTDWFYSREQELERAVAAFHDAISWADLQDADRPVAPGHVDASEPSPAPLPQPAARSRGPQPFIKRRATIEQYRQSELLKIAEWVASDGFLRTDEELVREILEALPFQRLGNRIRDRLQDVVKTMRRRQALKSAS
jgi:very-short-patch-repair endonuclease